MHSRTQTQIWRNRLTVPDALLIVAIMSAAAIFALEYEFFERAGTLTQPERRVSVEEFFALTAFLIVNLLAFSYWRLIGEKREIERRLLAERHAHDALNEAMHDPLTGLPNRRGFAAEFGKLLAPGKEALSHALLMLDLNGFKAVNDRFGHSAGDAVLRAVAERLRQLSAGGRFAARVGGDEFAILCRGVRNADEVRQFAQAIVAAIRLPIIAEGAEHRIGVCVGIALHPRDGRTGDELIHSADAALYRAKQTKRSAICEAA